MELEDNPLSDLTADQARALLGTKIVDYSPYPEPVVAENF